jgi:hypothetical protein
MERQIKRLAVYPHHTSCNAIMGAILFSPAVTPFEMRENFLFFQCKTRMGKNIAALWK